METRHTEGIIIDRRDFREHDSLVTVYTVDQGKIDLVARGTKRNYSKLVGHIEPISYSDLMIVFGRKINYIGSAFNIDAFAAIKSDYHDTVLAGKAIALFNKLIKHNDKDEDLYDILKGFLQLLNDGQIVDTDLFYEFFVLKIFAHLGYCPELYNCTICGEKVHAQGNFFSAASGGLICGQCGSGQDSRQISGDSIKAFRFVVDNDLSQTAKLLCAADVRREVISCISYFAKYNGE